MLWSVLRGTDDGEMVEGIIDTSTHSDVWYWITIMTARISDTSLIFLWHWNTWDVEIIDSSWWSASIHLLQKFAVLACEYWVFSEFISLALMKGRIKLYSNHIWNADGWIRAAHWILLSVLLIHNGKSRSFDNNVVPLEVSHVFRNEDKEREIAARSSSS